VVGRLRDGRVVRREQLADGRVRITVRLSSGAGVAATFRLGGRLGRRGPDIGAEGQAGGDLAHERTFVVPDGAAADRLIDTLDEQDPKLAGAVPAIVRFIRSGGRAGEGETSQAMLFSTRMDVEAVLGALDLGPRLEALRGVTAGVRIDAATHAPALLLRLGGEATAELAAPLAHLGAGTTSETGVELALDRDRRPVTLLVHQTHSGRGEARLRDAGAEGGQLVEAEMRLDLEDPAVRDLADRLVHGDLGAARELRARLADGARIDVRRYATTHDESSKGAQVKLGVAIGGERIKATDTARLVEARGREPGLGWAPRLDCGRVA
jgi:hypothetical protein